MPVHVKLVLLCDLSGLFACSAEPSSTCMCSVFFSFLGFLFVLIAPRATCLLTAMIMTMVKDLRIELFRLTLFRELNTIGMDRQTNSQRIQVCYQGKLFGTCVQVVVASGLLVSDLRQSTRRNLVVYDCSLRAFSCNV